MNFDSLDKFFGELGESEKSDPYLGVVLVRYGTGSEITISQDSALDIMNERYSGSDNFRGGYYMPYSETSWRSFVYEFFPGWSIYSFIV